MSTTSNLEQLARNYLTAPTLYRDELIKKLIDAGVASISPLLHIGLKEIFESSKENFKPIKEKAKRSRFGEEFAYNAWASTVESRAKDIYAIATEIRQPAMDTLCRMLYDKDDDIRLLTSLVLAIDPYPSSRTGQLVSEAIKAIVSNDTKKDYVRKGGIIMVLLIIIERSGTTEHSDLLKNFVAKEKVSREDYERKSRNTAVFYLLDRGAR